MEPRRPPEYTLEVFADPTCVKDVVKAILHTIFFHRYFIPITPTTRDLLDQTLPAVDDVDLETLIEQRANNLVRTMQGPDQNRPHLQSRLTSASPVDNMNQSGRGQITVSFYEKKRKKTYFFGKADEEVCWEMWTLDITCATPRTESGNREDQGPEGHGKELAKDVAQNNQHCKPGQGPYTADNNDRDESIPVSDPG